MDVSVAIGESAVERIAPISRQSGMPNTASRRPTAHRSIGRSRRAGAASPAPWPAPTADPARWTQPFYEALEDFRFLPAGRILSGTGSDRRVTLFNCFVMGDIAADRLSVPIGGFEACYTARSMA